MTNLHIEYRDECTIFVQITCIISKIDPIKYLIVYLLFYNTATAYQIKSQHKIITKMITFVHNSNIFYNIVFSTHL